MPMRWHSLARVMMAQRSVICRGAQYVCLGLESQLSVGNLRIERPLNWLLRDVMANPFDINSPVSWDPVYSCRVLQDQHPHWLPHRVRQTFRCPTIYHASYSCDCWPWFTLRHSQLPGFKTGVLLEVSYPDSLTFRVHRILARTFNAHFTFPSDRGITPARLVLDNAEKRGRIKSQQRKEWIEQRDQYASSRSKHLFSRIIKRGKTKISDYPLVTFFRDQFWYRTDGTNRPLLTLLWFAKDRSNLNSWLDSHANAGLFLSALLLATGSANALLIFGLWITQRSLMSVGGVWYGYGWEPQLAELTFHALFLVPFLSLDPFLGWNRIDGPYPVPKLVIWAVRWYLFKIMLGAGLIKLKSSDQKWKPGNMSAMYYFYETQVSVDFC